MIKEGHLYILQTPLFRVRDKNETIYAYDENEKNIKIVAEKIKMVAKEGMLSTRDIMATKGRASFLGERAIGHIDPGARSSQLAISAICDEYLN